MASKELSRSVEEISQLIADARDNYSAGERNEEWTKVALILPLLVGLGWNQGKDVGYENSTGNVEGHLDLVLKSQKLIGIEVKALDVQPPQDQDHKDIEKGLRQSKERGASYFIWTNGECWQFYSLALPNAPVYQVILCGESVDSIMDALHIREKEAYTARPEIFDEAIRADWEKRALPDTWEMLLEERANDLLQLFRQSLPTELDVKNQEIVNFLRKLRPDQTAPETLRRKPESIQHRSFTTDVPNARGRLLDPSEIDAGLSADHSVKCPSCGVIMANTESMCVWCGNKPGSQKAQYSK